MYDEELETTENEDTGSTPSVSENTTEPVPEDETGGGDTPETGDTGETGGGDTPETGDTGEIGGNDNGETSPSDSDGGTSDTGGGETSEVLVVLESVSEKLDREPDYSEIVESVRSLSEVMSVQTATIAELSGSSIPVSGYIDFSYPIAVTYRIFPTALGSETSFSDTYESPESFESGYSSMCDSVSAGNLAYFSIDSIADSNDEVVYEYVAVPEEPENPDITEEPDTFKEDVLVSLQTLHEDLQSVSMNDLDYREETLAFQKQYLELEKENRELHYQNLACNIAIGFALLLTLGYIVAHGFFQRMKVG